MTHAEKEVRNLEIVRLRHEGKSMSEIAEAFGLSLCGVSIICKRYGVDGVISQRKAIHNPGTGNQYTKRTEDEKREYVERELPHTFSYHSGYIDSDHHVNIKCNICGTVFDASMVSIRKHKRIECPVCREVAKAKRKEQKRREEALKREEEKIKERRARRWEGAKFQQMAMKQCPVCKSFFIGSKQYCSVECRNSNHWKMKDGYRYLFPLEEVYERDAGICYICGEQCDWDDYEVKNGVIVYGNKYPSREHVVPKSKGGKNTWGNIRLAHRLCNSKKGNIPLVKK